MKIKKQISVIMTDLSWGHINIFRGDTKGLSFCGIRRLRKELINHNLYLFT